MVYCDCGSFFRRLGGKIEAPITSYSDFEHLEANGVKKNVGFL